MQRGRLALPLLVSAALWPSRADARDWFVSALKGGGKAGTIEKPARDLGHIVSRLEPGDVVRLAGGVYTGSGESGADVITVPVSILGGYDEAFARRDPWGAHRTVLSGDVRSKNYKPLPRLHLDLSRYKGAAMPAIVVDGLILDQGAQNRYADARQLQIVRRADPRKGENPTPDRGALIVTVSRTGDRSPEARWKITIRNNVVLNSAPTQGAMTISGYRGSEVLIENNLVVNNTGSGIYAGTMYHGADSPPQFTLRHNTVLFTWKYDPVAQSFSGNSLKIDDDVVLSAEGNVFGYADRNGIHKGGTEKLRLVGNMIFGNLGTDYWETAGDRRLELGRMEDEAEHLHDDTADNVGELVAVPVGDDYLKKWGARVLIDRNAAAADVTAERTRENAIRRVLGLPLEAKDIGLAGEVWLPRLTVDDALAVGRERLAGRYGARAPKPE